MKAHVPFNTEAERKPVAIKMISLSWRQTVYLGVTLMFYIQLVEFFLSNIHNFFVGLIMSAASLIMFIPAIVLGFIPHKKSELYFDVFIKLAIRFHKKEKGVWRN